jgi:hypothetical protein
MNNKGKPIIYQSKVFSRMSDFFVFFLFGMSGAVIILINMLLHGNTGEFTKDQLTWLLIGFALFALFFPLSIACFVGYLSRQALENHEKRISELENKLKSKNSED